MQCLKDFRHPYRLRSHFSSGRCLHQLQCRGEVSSAEEMVRVMEVIREQDCFFKKHGHQMRKYSLPVRRISGPQLPIREGPANLCGEALNSQGRFVPVVIPK